MIYLSNIFFFFFFLLHKGAIASDFKAANMLPKQTKPLKTSMKSSGNTLFHICFANKSSVTTLLYASASFCDGHLRLAFISKFNYIISATTGSSQSTNVS